MSLDTPERGRLTDALVTQLVAQTAPGLPLEGVLVGDHFDPPGAGWSDLEPGEQIFVASVVLSTQPAEPLQLDPVPSNHTSWRMRYGLRSTGGARSQCDAAADRARPAVLALPISEIVSNSVHWRIQQVKFTWLGAVRPVKATDVPAYVIDDRFEVWLARNRG